MGDRIVVEAIEADGIERTSAGGIIIPATTGSKARTKNDTFRARIVAMGPDASRHFAGKLEPDDHVLVYAFAGEGERLYTGEKSGCGLFIKPDDIVCAVEAGAQVDVLRKELGDAFKFNIERPKGESKKATYASGWVHSRQGR